MRAYDELFNGEMTEDDGLLSARQEAAAAQQKRNQEATAAKEAALKPLLAELGGDNPRARAIAEGLQKQGIGSTKDIEVKQVFVPGYSYGSDESAGSIPDSTRNVYFNKVTGSEINPNRLGIIQNGTAGVKDGDIFFHLNADDQGNVKFEPEWSPRAHGFLRDNPIGQLIMKAGAVIPNPFQAAFVAANVGDALAHEKYGKALLAALPYAAQEFGVTDAIKGALGLSGPSGLDMGEVIPQGGIAEYLPSGFDVGDVIPQGGIAEYLPSSELANGLSTSAVTSPQFTTFDTGPVDGSPLDVSLADQTFQKIINPLDTDVPIDSMTARSIADSFYNPNGQLTNAAGNSTNLTLDDIIEGAGTSIDDIVGSDWSAGTPTTGMSGAPPADVVNGNKFLLQNGSLTDPSSLTTNTVADTNTVTKLDNTGVDEFGNSKVDLAGTKLDLSGNTINDTLTLDKALDLGKAYIDNPAALAGVIGTGLAATGLINNVTGGNNLIDTNQVADSVSTSKPVASMVPVGSTPGLQDLFNYADLYKSSPFVQQQTQQQTQQPSQQQYPGFTVSDVFRSLMADAAPQPKIEPNLVGLADLQKQMARK